MSHQHHTTEDSGIPTPDHMVGINLRAALPHSEIYSGKHPTIDGELFAVSISGNQCLIAFDRKGVEQLRDLIKQYGGEEQMKPEIELLNQALNLHP